MKDLNNRLKELKLKDKKCAICHKVMGARTRHQIYCLECAERRHAFRACLAQCSKNPMCLFQAGSYCTNRNMILPSSKHTPCVYSPKDTCHCFRPKDEELYVLSKEKGIKKDK